MAFLRLDLRSTENRRSHPSESQASAAELRNPEVSQDDTGILEQQVGWFDVSVVYVLRFQLEEAIEQIEQPRFDLLLGITRFSIKQSFFEVSSVTKIQYQVFHPRRRFGLGVVVS